MRDENQIRYAGYAPAYRIGLWPLLTDDPSEPL